MPKNMVMNSAGNYNHTNHNNHTNPISITIINLQHGISNRTKF
jgi:hypothetical protein